MKIIVNSEEEKKLLKRFIEQLDENDILSTYFNENFDEYHNVYEDDTIDVTEAEFIENGFREASIHVDEKEWPMEKDDDVIFGSCGKCGEDVQGTIDGDPVSYADFLDYQEKFKNKEFFCESCYCSI